jgi:hypothetical protein
MCDGSVRFVSNGGVGGVANYQRLSVPNDGNVASLD